MSTYKFEEIAFNSTEKKKPTEADRTTYIGLEHLDSGCLDISRFGSEVAPVGEKLIMRKGDVLFGKRRAYQKKVAIAPFDGIFSAHGMVLRPRTDVIDAGFFPFFISSDYFLDAAISLSVGSLSPTINWRDLKEMRFNLPELDEQRSLAKILRSMTTTIGSYKDLILKTDELVKSQFIEMFGDPTKNSKSWDLVPLTQCVDLLENGVSFVCQDVPRMGGWPGVLKLSAISKGIYLPNENKAVIHASDYIPSAGVHAGDLLFSRKNTPDLVGICAYVYETPSLLMLPDTIFRIRTNKSCCSIYLWMLLNHDVFREKVKALASGTAASMSNISMGRLRNLMVMRPPITLQREFVTFVQQLDKSKFELEKALSELTKTYKRILNEHLG